MHQQKCHCVIKNNFVLSLQHIFFRSFFLWIFFLDKNQININVQCFFFFLINIQVIFIFAQWYWINFCLISYQHQRKQIILDTFYFSSNFRDKERVCISIQMVALVIVNGNCYDFIELIFDQKLLLFWVHLQSNLKRFRFICLWVSFFLQ